MAEKGSYFPPWFVQISSIWGVVLIFSAYGVVHSIITRLAGPTLALDDVKVNIVTQSLQAGYLPDNPPLFEWILLFVQSVAGPGLISILIVKYGLMLTTGVVTYLIGKQLYTDRRWAVLTACSLVLFFQIGWNYHQAFTHTLVLIASVVFFWWAFLRLLQSNSLINYLLLGAALGIGLLSKHSFAGAAIAAIAAAMINSGFRKTILSPYMLLTGMMAISIASPHIAWLITQNADIAKQATARLQGDSAPHWLRALQGVPAALWSMLSFFLPFGLVFLVFFGRKLNFNDPVPELTVVMRNAAAIGAGGLILAVIIVGIPSLQERYVIVYMMPSLFWIVALAKNASLTMISISRYIMLVGVIAGFLSGLRLVQTAVPGKPFCNDCRQWIPYEAIREILQEAEFENGTLVGFTDHTAGNLRRLFPSARVISSHMPFYTPPGGHIEDDCYFIWSDQLGPAAPEAVTQRFDPATTYQVIGKWRHWMRPAGWRQTTWTVAKVNHDGNLTKALCRPQLPENEFLF